MINKAVLSRLTLVMLTLNRQAFVLRSMGFWSGRGPCLIVVDGSLTPIEPAKLEKLADNIKYLHNPAGFFDRLKFVLPLIKTDYVALIGDDEFYLPSALESCISKLDSDQDYVACCGRSLGFTCYSGKVYGYDQYAGFANYALENDDRFQRTIDHFSNYMPSLLYAVTQSSLWKKIFENILKREFGVGAIVEIQYQMLCCFAGKSIVLPQLYWLRSKENTPIRDTDPSLDRNNAIEKWWKDLDQEIVRSEFLTQMASGLSDVLSLNNEKVEPQKLLNLVQESMNKFVKLKEKRKLEKSSSVNERLASKMRRWLPGIIKNIVRQFMIFFELNKNFNYIERKVLEMKSNGVACDWKEIAEIEQIIISSHK